tara:strand:- start:391 stop:1182 length:792 start_codon:yes stop_codon:yes gene_type:complete
LLSINEIKKIENLLIEIGEKLLSWKLENSNKGRWIKDQFKSKSDLLTDILLQKGLKKITPGIPVLSEEDFSSHIHYKSRIYWIIDPIDGTASYCNGFKGYVTQIALMKESFPVNSFIYAPETKEMYTAVFQKGSKLNGENIYVSNSKDLTMIDNSPKPKDFSLYVYEKLKCKYYLESGSLGLKISLVASGMANLFLKNITVKDWDLAPAHLLLKEAGGHLIDFDGKNIQYNTNLKKENGIIAISSLNTFKLIRDNLNIKDYVK